MSRYSAGRRHRNGHFFEGLPCCDDSGSDDKPDGDEGCLDLWENKLETATRSYKLANASFVKFDRIHTDAVAWEKKLKGWFDDLCDAHEKAEGISSLLAALIKKVGITIQNAHATRKTVEALLCLVKEIFDCIVDLLKVCPPENTEGDIQKLKEAIKCDPNLDEKQKQEILACIQVFEDKIRLAYEMQEQVLKELLEMLNCANLIIGYIQKRRGLKWQLKDLQKRIRGAARRNHRIRHLCYERDDHDKMDDEDDDSDDTIDHDDPNEPCNVYDPPCGDDVFRPDQVLFPIDQSQYYKRVKMLHEEAEENAECLKKEKEHAKEHRDHALDRKVQYQKAVDASNAAEMGS